jgi:hypothetical protein
MGPIPEITDAEIEEARGRSPAEAENLERSRRRMREAQAAYGNAFAGLRADLAAAGFPVDSVAGLLAEFERTRRPYTGAVTVLVSWLERVDYEPLLDDIVRALSVPWAGPVASSPLVRLFRTGSESIRWTVGNALEAVADPTVAGQLIELVGDPRYGQAREPLVRALGRATNPDVVPALIRLLDDPELDVVAITALGDLRAASAVDRLRALRDSPDAEVRKRVTRALQRIG